MEDGVCLSTDLKRQPPNIMLLISFHAKGVTLSTKHSFQFHYTIAEILGPMPISQGAEQ